MSEEDADLYIFDKERGELSAERRPPHGIFPWPSFNWQRAGLVASIPLGLYFLYYAGICDSSYIDYAFRSYYALFGSTLLAAGIYSIDRTNGLRNIDNVSAVTKALTAFATFCGLFIIGVAVVLYLFFYLISLLVILVFWFFAGIES